MSKPQGLKRQKTTKTKRKPLVPGGKYFLSWEEEEALGLDKKGLKNYKAKLKMLSMMEKLREDVSKRKQYEEEKVKFKEQFNEEIHSSEEEVTDSEGEKEEATFEATETFESGPIVVEESSAAQEEGGEGNEKRSVPQGGLKRNADGHHGMREEKELRSAAPNPSELEEEEKAAGERPLLRSRAAPTSDSQEAPQKDEANKESVLASKASCGDRQCRCEARKFLIYLFPILVAALLTKFYLKRSLLQASGLEKGLQHFLGMAVSLLAAVNFRKDLRICVPGIVITLAILLAHNQI